MAFDLGLGRSWQQTEGRRTRLKSTYSEASLGRLVFAVALSSLILLALYVRFIYIFDRRILPEYFFWIFAAGLSVSAIILWTRSGDYNLLLITILVSAFVIASLPFLRFYFYGADLVGEYFVAETTRELARWTPERTIGTTIWLNWDFQKPTELLHRYFITTSDTIVPAILTNVTGASTRVVLWILLSVVSTVITMTGYAVTKICLNKKVALLSSMIFVFSTYYLGKFPNILHEDVALLFVLLVVLTLLKPGAKNVLLSVLWLILIPISHYGLFFLAPLVLFLLFASNKVFEYRVLANVLGKLNPTLLKEPKESLRRLGTLTLYSVIAGLVWLLSVAYLIFSVTVQGLAEAGEALLGLEPSRFTILQGHIFASSLGPFHTIVQWLERVLAVVGFFLGVRRFKTRKAFSFLFMGAGLLALALVLGILPIVNLLFDLDRSMQLALIGFSAFIAIALTALSRNRRLGTVLVVLVVTLILFESIQLPIFYSSAADMSRTEYVFTFEQVIGFYTVSDFQYARWVDQHVIESAVFSSDKNGCLVALIAERICVQPRGANASDTTALLESGKTDYFQVLSYLPDYIAFPSTKGEAREQVPLNSTETALLLSGTNLNRIYDNSRAIDFIYVPQT